MLVAPFFLTERTRQLPLCLTFRWFAHACLDDLKDLLGREHGRPVGVDLVWFGCRRGHSNAFSTVVATKWV